MYAIVETGSKQYKVSKGDTLKVELLNLKEEKEIKLDKVLFISDPDKNEVTVGMPYIEGTYVAGELIGRERGRKTISFRYRRRHASSKKKIGHRQNYTILKIKDIVIHIPV